MIPSGAARLSPKVQEIQRASACFDIYTNLLDILQRPRWHGHTISTTKCYLPPALWDEDKQDYKARQSRRESTLIDLYDAEKLALTDWLLTVATLPTVFLPVGDKTPACACILAISPPELAGSVSACDWENGTPYKRGHVFCGKSLAKIRRANFFPASIIVELEYGDSHVYGSFSLPFIVVGLPTSYHHEKDPFSLLWPWQATSV